MTPTQSRRIVTLAIAAWLAILVLIFTVAAFANPLEETRYVTEVKRDAKGQILRRADVLAAFQRIHPCPSTGLKTGACKGWQKNHVVSLACGGADSVSNMQWLPTVIKTGWQDWSVDRFERKIYKSQTLIAGVSGCKKELVIITDPINSN